MLFSILSILSLIILGVWLIREGIKGISERRMNIDWGDFIRRATGSEAYVMGYVYFILGIFFVLIALASIYFTLSD